MDMTLAQRAVAFVAIIFLFLLVCFVWAAHAKMAPPRPELRLTTLSGEYSERIINSPGGSRGFWIFDFDPTFRPA
jgi:hypothetical protein